MSEKISKATAEAATPRASRYVVWDSELRGFGLRVESTGAKTFVVKYRADGGGRNAPQRLMSLGRFPTVKVGDARTQATKVLAAASLGQDPVGDLAAKRREMKVSELLELYEGEGCFVQRGIRQGEPMKPTTKAYTLARLQHHVLPLLGPRRVSDLTEGDIERFVRLVAKGATAKDQKIGPRKRIIVRGGEGAARKVVRDLSAVLSFAVRRRIISANPVAMASVRKTDNQRSRFLTLQEMKRLGEALDKLEAEGINPKGINIARLWALTGCRRNEIAGLKWSSVDFDLGVLAFDDSKTGRSIRPLATAAATLLKELKAEASDDVQWVFPAERGDGHYAGAKDVWSEVIKRAALPGVTPHSLRHSLGSAAASGGEALLLVGAILGHANARSTQIYAHVDRNPARLAADRAVAGIAAALGRPGPLPKPPGQDWPTPANDPD